MEKEFGDLVAAADDAVACIRDVAELPGVTSTGKRLALECSEVLRAAIQSADAAFEKHQSRCSAMVEACKAAIKHIQSSTAINDEEIDEAELKLLAALAEHGGAA